MTGRRAVRQWDERLSRALQFVPGHVGGRVASAQPIRRRGGTLRQASVGATGAPAIPAHIGYLASGLVAGAGTTYQLWNGTADLQEGTGGGTPNDYQPATGDAVVAHVAAFGETLTAPTGWTVLDSGATGTNLHWLTCWKTVAGSDDWDVTVGTTTNIVGALWVFRDGTATPVVTVAEYTAATSAAIPATPTSGWVLACATGVAGGDPNLTDPSPYVCYANSVGVGGVDEVHHAWSFPTVGTEPVGNFTTTASADIATFAFGWA